MPSGLGDQGGEAGLLGVAVSPDFDDRPAAVLLLSTATDNRIVKATPDGGRLGTPTVILDGIPHGFIHDGGRLAFGPDGYLYASTGETGDGELAQDKDTTAGKILRITTDGDPAPGNPFKGSPIWSYGHRNVQGLAFDDRDRLWASEFGQNTFDELNLIKHGHELRLADGRGHGRRRGSSTRSSSGTPTRPRRPGLAWLDGHLWMASLKGERLWRVDVERRARPPTPPTSSSASTAGCAPSSPRPTASLWVTTSNTDGRGDPQAGDDRILLIEP